MYQKKFKLRKNVLPMQLESREFWSEEEDRKLIELIDEHGIESWSRIGKMMSRRNGKQCRERWHTHLKPEIDKSPLRQEEKEIILDLQSKHGNKWTLISTYLPGRSTNTIKNFYNAYKNRKSNYRNRRETTRESITIELNPDSSLEKEIKGDKTMPNSDKNTIPGNKTILFQAIVNLSSLYLDFLGSDSSKKEIYKNLPVIGSLFK